MSKNRFSKLLGLNNRTRTPKSSARSKHSAQRLASISLKQFALAVEPLEERQLLAINVTQANLSSFKDASGNYVFNDSSSITVDPGVVIDAGAGAITMTAPEISIGTGAQIKTSGAISLAAEWLALQYPISAFNQLVTIGQALTSIKASVAIGENVSIDGGSFTVDVKSGDQDLIKSGFESAYTAIGDNSLANFFTGVGESVANTGLQLLNDVWSLPLSVQVKQPESSITVGANSVIKTSGAVSMTEKATADATGQAIWSSLLQAGGFGLAIGFSYTDAKATMNLAPSARIEAGGKVAITSTVTDTGAMTSRVSLNQGGTEQTSTNNIAFATAVAVTNATSRISLDAGSVIQAGKNVVISATVTEKTSAKAATASYRDGKAGVTVGVGVAQGTAEVIVNGAITTTGKIDVPATLSFNPGLSVDFATDSIIFPSSVSFSTGDEMIYSSDIGGAIPGLVDGQSYWAIVDPAEPKRLKVAASEANALAGRAIDFGAGYPTLAGPQGTPIPIVSVNAAESDTISFGYDTWADGTPLFTDGQLVTYTPLAGQFLGRNDATGNLIGALPAGSYRVQVVPNTDGEVGMQIRLLDVVTNQRIDLNDNPQFVTDSGKICQVFSFNADEGSIDFNFPVVSGITTPQQTIDFVDAQRIKYVQAFGSTVPGLVDGQYYYAVVDPANPGVIQLADSQSQAEAADPSVQNASPKLDFYNPVLWTQSILSIVDVKPGLGLLFVTDPQIPAGTPVVFRQVAGKPVGGVTDGVTYYAYPQANANFDPSDPQYFIGLRTAPDTTLPLIDFASQQTLQAGSTNLAISGIDANYGQIALALPQAAPVKTADASQLAGSTPSITITTIPADSPQLYSTATGGTFSIQIPAGGNTVSTEALPWNATADQIRLAINNAGVVGVMVTAVYGAGTADDPWTIVGTGLGAIDFDQTAIAGGGIYSRFTPDESQAVTTTATGGTFTLSFKVGDTLATTAALAYNATPGEIRAAIDAIGGVLAGKVYGTGAVGHPWMIGARVQPLKTGDPVVFHDAFGWTNPGLVDGD